MNSSSRFENGLTVDRSKNSEAIKLSPREFSSHLLTAYTNTEINPESVPFRVLFVFLDDLNVIYEKQHFTRYKSVRFLKKEVDAILYPLTENNLLSANQIVHFIPSSLRNQTIFLNVLHYSKAS